MQDASYERLHHLSVPNTSEWEAWPSFNAGSHLRHGDKELCRGGVYVLTWAAVYGQETGDMSRWPASMPMKW